MDSEKIKILRNKIAIPLDIAIKLLKKNNSDVDISEQEFHNSIINGIIIATECNYETARESYDFCK